MKPRTFSLAPAVLLSINSLLLISAQANAPTYAPQLGEANSIFLTRTGSRLMMAMVRQQGSQSYLWTCQHVGLDGTDQDYDGTETGSTVDRSGIQWLKLAINTTGTPLTYSTHARICDTASSNPYYYYMPSLMVNSSGDLLAAFSGSRATERIGAFFSGRRANGTNVEKPVLIQAGRDFSRPDGGKWGDYSYTSIDPVDGSFWTVQEYAEVRENATGWIWGTWISSVKINP